MAIWTVVLGWLVFLPLCAMKQEYQNKYEDYVYHVHQDDEYLFQTLRDEQREDLKRWLECPNSEQGRDLHHTSSGILYFLLRARKRNNGAEWPSGWSEEELERYGKSTYGNGNCLPSHSYATFNQLHSSLREQLIKIGRELGKKCDLSTPNVQWGCCDILETEKKVAVGTWDLLYYGQLNASQTSIEKGQAVFLNEMFAHGITQVSAVAFDNNGRLLCAMIRPVQCDTNHLLIIDTHTKEAIGLVPLETDADQVMVNKNCPTELQVLCSNFKKSRFIIYSLLSQSKEEGFLALPFCDQLLLHHLYDCKLQEIAPGLTKEQRIKIQELEQRFEIPILSDESRFKPVVFS